MDVRIRPELRAVFTASPGLSLLLTPGLTILDASDAYRRATVTCREDIVGCGLFEAFSDTLADRPHRRREVPPHGAERNA